MELILNISFIAILAVLLLIFLHRRIKKGQSTPHLTIALVLSLIFGCFYIIEILLYIENSSEELIFAAENIGIIAGILTYFVVFLHYEALSSIKPNFSRYNLMVLLVIPTIILTITGFFISSEELVKILTLRDLFGVIFNLACFAFPLIVSIRINKTIKERAARLELLSLLLIQISNIIYFIMKITVIFNFPLDITYTDLNYLSDFALIIGIIILLSNYIIHKDYIYRLPFPIHEFFIINQGGIITYHRHVSSTNLSYFDDSEKYLLSGAIKAISTLIRETLGTESQLRFIDVKSYKIYLSQVPKEDIIVAIITSGVTYFLKKSLDRFINSITKDAINRIQDGIIEDEELYEELDIILIRTFPYLVIRKEESES